MGIQTRKVVSAAATTCPPCWRITPELLCAEGLDDVRNDKDALMARALDRAAVLGAEF